MRRSLLLATALIAIATPAFPQAVDRGQVNRIIDEGTTRSQVMVTAEHLADVIGPRLTNSPGMRQAESWTQSQFAGWGLKNVHKEGFDFGRGWWISSSSVRMITPRPIQLTAIPIAWTPSTNGTISAPVFVAPMTRERDFDKWRGKLRGKIVLVTLPNTGSEPGDPAFKRYTSEDIGKLDQYQQPSYDPEAADRRLKRLDYAKKLDAFLKAEGAVAYATMSRLDGKLVHGEGYLFGTGDTQAVPGVEIAAEDYRRLARLAKVGPAPTVEINSDVRFDDSDRKAYNIIAEIPGTDPKAGYVMAGAHLDSWVAGDGAADNGAGTAMIMEAARILSATGIRPKRTIRFALWAGEEQGLLGSLAYVEDHLATRGKPGDPVDTGLTRYYSWSNKWPITPKAGWGDLAAYFNLDNGSGKIRGIYVENNQAVAPIFRDWLAPFGAMGAKDVVIRKTGGTDHVFMQAVGAPGFQFIQDPLDYGSRVHHTSIDTFDHLKGDDMRQASIILASFLANAANADKALPRPPLPTQPVVTDPFAYSNDDD
ncbi:MAG: family metallo-hydrolase [Sphingomonas bacterium]|uniref:M20/M25/M40 family metallo-hydrolase n=1 Tax=Sphingomonas bacterium TaxID=1895847 RepID=UPI002630DF87|nr:M20/M25/M40 family metallo-hydrolase [Sphingomonas bacterium]MDB5706032.1 family metallo-hydrolase [Sphingomonas bacterium]